MTCAFILGVDWNGLLNATCAVVLLQFPDGPKRLPKLRPDKVRKKKMFKLEWGIYNMSSTDTNGHK